MPNLHSWICALDILDHPVQVGDLCIIFWTCPKDAIRLAIGSRPQCLVHGPHVVLVAQEHEVVTVDNCSCSCDCVVEKGSVRLTVSLGCSGHWACEAARQWRPSTVCWGNQTVSIDHFEIIRLTSGRFAKWDACQEPSLRRQPMWFGAQRVSPPHLASFSSLACTIGAVRASHTCFEVEEHASAQFEHRRQGEPFLLVATASPELLVAQRPLGPPVGGHQSLRGARGLCRASVKAHSQPAL
eukprot:4578998-Amphidinium_carterae.1